jgi:Family of unknown function (DUF6496)
MSAEDYVLSSWPSGAAELIDPAPFLRRLKERFMPRKYGKASASKVKRAMHEMKRGELKSGRSGRTVRSRKQAIAIGLSEARRAGAKVPRKRK